MKIVTLSIILVVIYIDGGVQSECCMPKKLIQYNPKSGYSCKDSDGRKIPTFTYLPSSYEYECEIFVCGDGKEYPGVFCGQGGCNMFGCNCDNGCIPGNDTTYRQNFLNNNFNKIENIENID